MESDTNSVSYCRIRFDGYRHRKNITFEYLNTAQLRILDTQNRIRKDKNSSRPDRIRIREIFVPFTSLVRR